MKRSLSEFAGHEGASTRIEAELELALDPGTDRVARVSRRVRTSFHSPVGHSGVFGHRRLMLVVALILCVVFVGGWFWSWSGSRFIGVRSEQDVAARSVRSGGGAGSEVWAQGTVVASRAPGSGWQISNGGDRSVREANHTEDGERLLLVARLQ